MSVTINKISFYSGLDEDGSNFGANLSNPPLDIFSNPLNPNYLRGGIGQKHWVAIDLSVQWGLEFVEFSTNLVNQTVTITDGEQILSNEPAQITRNTNASFIKAGFVVGDAVQFLVAGVGFGLPVIITSITHKEITLNFGIIDTLFYADLNGVTPIQALDFKYNIIGNNDSDTFVSRLNGVDENKFSITNLDTNDLVTENEFIPLGDKNWHQIDETITSHRHGYVLGAGFTPLAGTQRFLLFHSFTNLDISSENFDADGNIDIDLLEEFIGEASQKYIYDIGVKTDLLDANYRFQFSDGDAELNELSLKDGNVGFYDELYNGGATTLSVSSVTYEDNATTDPVSSLIINKETKVKITITDSTTGVNGFFTTGADEGVAQISLFEKPTATINEDVSKSYLENINFNRVIFNYGGTISSDNLIEGDGIVSLTGTLIDSKTLELEMVVAGTGDFMTGEDYIMTFNGVGVEATQSIPNIRIALLADEGKAEIFFPNDYCTSLGSFKHHGGIQSEVPKGVPEDGLFSNFCLTINKEQTTGSKTYDIDLKSVTIEIVAEHQTDSTRNFVLQSDVFNTGLSNYTSKNKGYQLKTTDEFNTCFWQELYTDETPTQKFFDLGYAFKLRWEEWRSLITDPDFLLTSNNVWHQYQNTDWKLKYNIVTSTEVTEQGTTETFIAPATKSICFDEFIDYEETCEIFGFTATYSKLEIVVSDLNNPATIFTSKLPKDRKLKVVATIEGDWSSTPSYPFNIYGLLRLDATTTGGVSYIRELSSLKDVPNGSEWEGVSNPLRADLTIDDSVAPFPIVIEGIIDGTKLDDSSEFCISARVGASLDPSFTPPVPATAKLLENGELKNLEDATIKIIE